MVVKRNKEKVSIAMSSYLVNRAKAMVDAEEFGSVSDVISTAMSQFILMYDQAKRDGDTQFLSTREYVEDTGDMVESVIKEYLKSPEGKALIKSIIGESLSSPSKSDKPIVVEHIYE
ncbi:hypothetical protein [Methanolobus profundi]|uniref:Uncharacterized protein n=1 Tax=Methanolobus profundi TaxID=487685 RepID=A0A1I4QJH0_9EURY|nr:hypothetical protein [Methanolobus profundi]SFM40238.1 hypothetical protein SAMN04488696_1057 [Methanolobus profundi]